MIKINLPKWWQLSLASTVILGSAIASGGNYASAQINVQNIKPTIRGTIPQQRICPPGTIWNNVSRKCVPKRHTVPEGDFSQTGSVQAVPLPPQIVANLKQNYPDAIQRLKQEDPQALRKLREGDPATLQRLQQIEPKTTQILQPYLRQRIQVQPHLREFPNRDRWRN